MKVICFDFESILVPEIWLKIAEETGLEELKLTTRDVSDYQELMEHRIDTLRENNIKINEIRSIISDIKPLIGAKGLVKEFRDKALVTIVTDSFYEFIFPLLRYFDYPMAFARNLKIENNYIKGYEPKKEEIKAEVIKNLKEFNLDIIAIGDSYNDLNMLKKADKPIFFKPSEKVIDKIEDIEVAENYQELRTKIL